MYNTKLSNIMTTDLVTVTPNDTLEKVDEIFNTHDFHHIPVVGKGGKIMGIISKTDYLLLSDSMTLFKKESSRAQNLRLFRSLLVHEVMTKQVARLYETDTVSVAVGFFKENIFHAIPVINKAEKLVGIVTTFDLINYAYREPAFISDSQ